jgi:hypothetical protein
MTDKRKRIKSKTGRTGFISGNASGKGKVSPFPYFSKVAGMW